METFRHRVGVVAGEKLRISGLWYNKIKYRYVHYGSGKAVTIYENGGSLWVTGHAVYLN